MDPPEEDVNALELASLIEETTNDHSSNNGSGSRPPLHPSRQQQFRSPRNNNNTNFRQHQQSKRSLPIATTATRHKSPAAEAQADVGEVKEDDEEEKVDETNAASVAEVVPLSTTNHETEEEKTSTKCISTHTLCLLIT